MELDSSPMVNEIKEILTNGINGTAFAYDAYVYVKNENMSYKAPKVIAIDILRDYVNNYCDKTILTLAFTPGIYAYHIYPNSDGLEITLVRKPIFIDSGAPDYTKEVYVETFTATPVDNKSPTVNQTKDPTTEEILNQSDILPVEFDLISKTNEFIKMIQVGGVFRNTTAESVVKTLLTNQACQQTGNNDLIVKGVDMIPASNIEVRDHIIIPQGIALYDVPNYIQTKCGGIYNAGLGCFIQERMWYIYPAYDYTRYENTDRTILFCVIPSDKLPNIERTFRRVGSQINVIAGGQIVMNNAVDQDNRNKGNGVSFTVGASILHNMVKTGGDEAIVNRAESNTEVATNIRSDGDNYVPVSSTPITDNAMNEFSKLAARQAGTVVLTWENSEPEAIVPGMMAKIYYVENEQIKETVGVVGGAQHYVYMAKKGFSNDRYLNNTAITIHLDPSTI